MQLARAHGCEVAAVEGPRDVVSVLNAAAEHGQKCVFMLAGDGTVQAAVDHLATLGAGAEIPQLLLLGGGRSNLTARDLGWNGRVLETLQAALARSRSGEAFAVEHRQALRIEQAPAEPRHGFFMAAGLVDRVIRTCHDRRRAGGHLRSSHAGTAWTILTLAAGACIGRQHAAPADLQVEVPDREPLARPARLLIVTTLRRLGAVDPFADRGAGTLRVTAIAERAHRLWRSLPRVLAGRFSGDMDGRRGYLSGRCQQLQLRGLERYTLDGEEFDADPTRPVLIREGMRIGFLKP